MPWMGRHSKPAPNAGHRRHSSIVETSSKHRDATAEDTLEPLGPLHRLSLRLPNSDEEMFANLTNEVVTTEPDELGEAEEAPAHESPPQEAEAMTAEPEQEPEQEPEPKVEQHQLPRQEQERASSHPVKPQRFSLLKFRHASDSQLSTSYRSSAVPDVPVLPPPTIITTSPTTRHFDEPMKKSTKNKIFDRSKRPFRALHTSHALQLSSDDRPGSTQSLSTAPSPLRGTGYMNDGGPHRFSSVDGVSAPPPYGDDLNTALAIPVARLSESSRSDASSEHGIYAQTTTTHTVSTTTTFFRLPRRKKDKGPLFPLPDRVTPIGSGRNSTSRTPRASTTARSSTSPERDIHLPTAIRFDPASSNSPSPFPSPTSSSLALTNAPFGSPGPSVVRKESMMSARSGTSTPSVSLAPPRLGVRGRSSTMGSLGRSAETVSESSPTVPPSGRTSTSTTGRKSFGDIFSLSHRLRHNSEPPVRNGSGHSPGTPGSKSNSLQIPREEEPELVYPEREDSDTPASYLEKLEAAVPRGSMATILCKSADEFCKTCLRKYMRGFSYFGDSIDIAVRKMLMEVELPKETQQIDRLLAGFADRYHECNPGIFTSADEASIAAFSILLLHSDTHNKNNKRKMQKQDYVKNTQGPVQISADILQCFYDNVCYTPFIHFEDEVAVHSHRLAAPKHKKSLIRTRSSESLRGPVDPYALILDNKLSVLRPSLKEVMDTEDTYNFTGTANGFDVRDMHTAFLKSSVLQIVSARSRPDAFMTQATISNPAEAQAGLVSIKVAKVGLLWRKDPKKKKAKRPWQEWGAILTDSKLYFFRDVGWIKKLMTQHETHQKQNKKAPLVFTPPLSTFEPDALMSVDDAVALMDSSYKKHKNAFVFIKHGGFEEIFLANSEVDMNDWLGKLNYVATFRTAGVRMRGLVGTPQEVDRQQIMRKNSQLSTMSTESQPAETSVAHRKLDPQIAWEIMYYRRQIINERISDYDEKLAVANKELDHLLRNARHLQILLPIQAKTREAIILAAGRMSAKLKWTRIEIWRARCHRDILRSDLEQEGIGDFPAPASKASSATVTPQKATQAKTSQQDLNRTSTITSNSTLSPVSTPTGRRVHTPEYDRATTPDPPQPLSPETPISAVRRKSAVGLEIPTVANGGLLDIPVGRTDNSPESHSLAHQASIISSHRSKADAERYVKPSDDAEEQVLREAGLFGIDGAVPSSKRPDTSGSEKDRVVPISPDISTRDRGGSVRRSLQRTLREPHHSHHAPVHHRSKKGRDSGSSLAAPEDGTRSMSGESLELRRGTGSFIVHGKKASVVTFGSEWQHMSNEDRMKLRTLAHEEETKTEGEVEDGNASNTAEPATGLSVETIPDHSSNLDLEDEKKGKDNVPAEHAADGEKKQSIEEPEEEDFRSAAEDTLDSESEAQEDLPPLSYHKMSTSVSN